MIKALLSILVEADQIIEELQTSDDQILQLSEDLTSIDQMITDYSNQNQKTEL